jgi:hypothetical protein
MSGPHLICNDDGASYEYTGTGRQVIVLATSAVIIERMFIDHLTTQGSPFASSRSFLLVWSVQPRTTFGHITFNMATLYLAWTALLVRSIHFHSRSQWNLAWIALLVDTRRFSDIWNWLGYRDRREVHWRQKWQCSRHRTAILVLHFEFLVT